MEFIPKAFPLAIQSFTIRNVSAPKPVPFLTAFLTLFIINTLYAFYSPMDDCDEVFNYWEPLHFIVKGKGFQTWEYTPKYALRSYLYILIYAVPLAVLKYLVPKASLFYIVRVMNGAASAYCQAFFYQSVFTFVHPMVGNYLFYGLLCGTGFFISTTALLPNSFSMCIVFLIYSYWMRQRFHPMLILAAISISVGWPFAVVAIIFPVLFFISCSVNHKNPNLNKKIDEKDFIIRYKVEFSLFTRIREFFMAAFISLLYIALPSFLVDRFFYGNWTWSTFNTVAYNLLGNGTGPELYGTEKWTYYFINGLLNFNFLFIIALVSLPLSFLIKIPSSAALPDISFSHVLKIRMIPFYIGFLFFSAQAHKEERFLFVVYPLLCFNAAIGLFLLSKKFGRIIPKLILIGYVIVSISRNIALSEYYNQPIQLYGHVNPSNGSSLCLGKEWYRFPSHFHVDDKISVHFLRSAYRGILPKYFIGTNLTSGAVNPFNKEETDRYVPREECDWVVESTLSDHEYSYEYEEFNRIDLLDNFVKVKCVYLLKRSVPFPFRSFYTPFETQLKFDEHCLFKRK